MLTILFTTELLALVRVSCTLEVVAEPLAGAVGSLCGDVELKVGMLKPDVPLMSPNWGGASVMIMISRCRVITQL